MAWEIRRCRPKPSSASNSRPSDLWSRPFGNPHNRLFQFVERPCEKMIAGVNKLEMLWLGEPFKRRFQFLLRSVFVDCALDKILRNAATGEIVELPPVCRKTNRNQPHRSTPYRSAQ